MTDSLEHRACSEALGAYALRALPEDEAERVRRHLEECPACRAELDRLQVAVEALPASVEQIEPPPELKSRLMSIVESEAEVRRAGREAADRPPTKSRWRRLPRWLPVAGAVAAACAVAAVIVLLAAGGGAATRTVEAQVSAPLRAGGAVAALKITGDRAKLVVARLPAPPAGYVHELWVKHGSAPPKPAGTFVVRSGSVDVARPVRAGDQVLVTAEPGHGTSAPTSAPLIVARV